MIFLNLNKLSATMCYKSNSSTGKLDDTQIMIEQPKFSDKNAAFVIFSGFHDSVGFEECYFNDTSFNYYIRIKLFQRNIYGSIWFSNSIINKNETNTSFGIYGSNFDQQHRVRLSFINFTINQSWNIITIIKNETVNDLNILQFSGHSCKIMKIFHNYFNTDSAQNSVLNSLFGGYILYAISTLNITHTKFTINKLFLNNYLTCIELYNHKFDNCNMSTIMGTPPNNEYTDVIYSEHNDFNGNNHKLTILLSIMNNIFLSSVSNAIVGTEATSLNAENILYFHDIIFKENLLKCDNEYLIKTIDILNTNLDNSYSLIVAQYITLCSSFSKIRNTDDIVFNITSDYFICDNINDKNGSSDKFIWDYYLNHNTNSKITCNLKNLMLVATALIMDILCQWILTYQSIVLKLNYHLNIQVIVALFSIYNNKLKNYGTMISERT